MRTTVHTENLSRWVHDHVFDTGRDGDELAEVSIRRVHDRVGRDRRAEGRIVGTSPPLRLDP